MNWSNFLYNQFAILLVPGTLDRAFKQKHTGYNRRRNKRTGGGYTAGLRRRRSRLIRGLKRWIRLNEEAVSCVNMKTLCEERKTKKNNAKEFMLIDHCERNGVIRDRIRPCNLRWLMLSCGSSPECLDGSQWLRVRA